MSQYWNLLCGSSRKAEYQKLDDPEEGREKNLDQDPKKKKEGWKTSSIIKLVAIILFACLALTLLVLLFIPNSPVQDFLLDALETVEGFNEVVGCLVIGSSYAVALLIMLPGTPWNLAAGYLYGIWIGSAVALTGVTAGAVIAFLLGRFVLRSWAESMQVDRPFFRSLDRAISKHGLKLIFLTRLSPILPFPLLNYLFGVTPVTFFNYLIATALGIIPLTVLYCWIGSQLRNVKDVFSSQHGDKTETIIYLVVAIVGTALVLIVVTWITRSAIKSAIAEIDKEDREKEAGCIVGERVINETSSLKGH